MKRGKYTILVLVITVSIIVFLLLNLLLGSVSIPFASVWNILTGGREIRLPGEYHTEIPGYHKR